MSNADSDSLFDVIMITEMQYKVILDLLVNIPLLRHIVPFS